MFGGAFLAAGHSLSALDAPSQADKSAAEPFRAIYHRRDLIEALQLVDLAVLWGSDALTAVLRQAITTNNKRNILLFSYVFSPAKAGTKHRILDWSLKMLAPCASGLVLMTGEQTRQAKSAFGGKIPVIQLRCGIDTQFYRADIGHNDVPENYRKDVDKLHSEPYVILPGDELRLNDDAIRFVELSGIRLVRVSQYGYKSGIKKLKGEIARRRLGDRLVLFEGIDYTFLRFLLRHASAYVGLVDSSWQPAGWTVACESLASGLPVVLYDGLVSRELTEIRPPKSCVQTVGMADVTGLADKISTLIAKSDLRGLHSAEAVAFADQQLSLDVTGPAFVAEVEQLVGR